MTASIFDLCVPRDDVRKGVTDADYAADLAQVINGSAPIEYRDPVKFFANTFPTRGLKTLLENVCLRLSGSPACASVFRLDTSFGGGKTHGLIALVHAARGMKGVANISEFVNPSLVPTDVRIAEFDGENADPLNGRKMAEGVYAKSPWGELAYRLAGKEGYERVRKSDEAMVAPGAETIQELFGGKPTLILLDELAVWLRKVQSIPGARDQLSPFLMGLFKAVESTPNCAIVFTLSVGKDGKAPDAHGAEAIFVADRMSEAESVAARKATLLNPTEDDETVQVLRRRLFDSINMAGAKAVVDEYKALWQSPANKGRLSPEAGKAETSDAFLLGYPFHPDLIHTLTSKTATLGDFQRVRGMLRILGKTIAKLWADKPADATAIHVHHIDPGYAPIYSEISTKLGQRMYVPAIRNDISAEVGHKSLAQDLDDTHYKGLAPYTQYVARTAFLNTLAHHESLKGVTPDELRYAILSPTLDISFVDDARQKFIAESAYLDDKPLAPLRFLAEANLTQVIRREERNVDPGEATSLLNDLIKTIFGGTIFDMVPFPGGPYDVADDIGDGRPKLAVMAYDGVAVGGTVESVPDLITRIHQRKGSEGTALRTHRNNLVFILADDGRVGEMKAAVSRRIALRELKKADRLAQLADHQQLKVKEEESKSEHKVALAIQQCYRHVFYPSTAPVGDPTVSKLAHSAVEYTSASERPGSGQLQIIRTLRDLLKLRSQEDEPDNPTYIRDKTPLKKGQMSSADLRAEFRKDVALPILVDDEIFRKAIRKGVEAGEYVYRRGELLYGKGDPLTSIVIDQESIIFTMGYATTNGIWPRPDPAAPPQHALPLTSGGQSISEPPPAPGTSSTSFGSGGGTAPPIHGSTPISSPTAQPVQPPVPSGPPTFAAQGVLKGALTQIWEQAKAKKIVAIASLKIDMFDASDAFRLLGAVGAIAGATKVVTLTGGYETSAGSSLNLEFSGNPDDAKPLKEFLEPQLRAAKEKSLTASFELTFDAGLSLVGDATEKLTERLARFASGAAYVSATAEAKV